MASITQRGPYTYKITVSLGRKGDGTQNRKSDTFQVDQSLTGKKLEKEIDRLADEFERKCKSGQYLDGADLSLSEFATKWLELTEKELAPKTYQSYSDLLEKRILPFVGHLKMDKLQPANILDLYAQLSKPHVREDNRFSLKPAYVTKIRFKGISKFAQECGLNEKTTSSLCNGGLTTPEKAEIISKYFQVKPRTVFDKVEKNDGKLSGNTVHHIHSCLSSMFSTAVAWQVIESSPIDRVKAPRIAKKEARVYDEDQIENMFSLLEQENDIRLKAIVYLTALTGARLGEISGLEWSDVDFDNRLLTIRQAAQYVNDKRLDINSRSFLKSPKNETSARTIAVPDLLTTILKEYRKYQLEQKLALGKEWQAKEKKIRGKDYDSNRIIKAWDGCAVHPDYPSKVFKAFREKNNLPPLTFHQLRHSNASLLIGNGIDVATLSRRLGHSNPNTTTKIYSHALRRPDQESSDKLQAMFSKKPSEQKSEQA